MSKYLKRAIPLLIILLLVVFFIRRGIQWSELQAVLRQAKWGWLLLALLFQAISLGAVTWLNELLLRHYGARVPFGKQYIVQLAMAFIETVVPSAAISGAMLRIRLLKSDGVSPDVATVTTMIEMALITTSVVLLALPVAGVAMLQGAGGLSFSSRGLVGLSGALTLLAFLGWKWRSSWFSQVRRKTLEWVARFWDQRIRRRWRAQLWNWPSERIIQRGSYLIAELLPFLKSHPKMIVCSLLTRTSFEIAGFAMCFLAMGQALPWSTMILVYALTLAANMMGTIPGAMGMAEVALAALYTQFGVPSETALAISLAYRLTGYWMPRLGGGIAWLWLERRFPRRIAETRG